MGFQVQKTGNTYRLTYQDLKTARRNISKKSREAMAAGFRPDMTYEQARERVNQLRSQAALQREIGKEIRQRAKLEKGKLYRTAYLTDSDAAEFWEKWGTKKRMNPSHWTAVQKAIATVAIDPSDWFELSHKFYEHFVASGYSPAYVKKIKQYLNLYGYFYTKKYNKPWKDLDRPDGHWKSKMAGKYSSRIGGREDGSSEPISPELLESKRAQLTEHEYNWILISVWFGLRPEEVDQLLNDDPNLWKYEGGYLRVFQTKLQKRGVPISKCWKFIPTSLFPQQKAALEVIRSKNFKRPVGKTGKKFREVFGKGYSAYGGRNNFVPMLRAEGYDKETCSEWMGHLSIKTTEKFYEGPKKPFYRPPVKKVA